MSAQRVLLSELDGTAFQHPRDKEATDNLKKLIGFDRLVAKFLELGYERLNYVYNSGSSVRVSETQFPRLYAMLRDACAILDVTEPELYVSQAPIVNAYTSGHTQPHIMVYTAMLDLLSDEELFAMIGHELGHIKCGHVLYYTMANSISTVISILGQLTFGIGRIIGATIEAALLEWRRRSELSADRAALLTVQDPRPVVGMLTKMAGGTHRWSDQLSPEAFLEQARRFKSEGESEDLLDMIYRSFAEFTQGTHPFAVERVREIDDWSQGEEYAAILKGDYPKVVKRFQVKVNKSK
ncbi:Protease HtpX [Anaerolineae bacterium]|nr:Protease HtpX [Anaerolineae bacterium]